MISKKNIMFLVDRYIPYPSANGICCENIVQQFVENGCKVWIGSYKFANDSKAIENGCTLFSIGKVKKIENKISLISKIIHYIRWILPLRKFPATLNYRKANIIIKKCKKIIRDYSIDYVVCFHFPVEIIYAGYKLKKQ